jgi:hypothetical protein
MIKYLEIQSTRALETGVEPKRFDIIQSSAFIVGFGLCMPLGDHVFAKIIENFNSLSMKLLQTFKINKII